MTDEKIQEIAKEVAKDIEAIKKAKPSKRQYTVHKDPGEFPLSLLDFPNGGFLPAIMDYTLSTAPRPNKPLAFAGALIMCSHIIGRRYRCEDGTRPNLFLIALADSGVGKDHPRKVNRAIGVETGLRTSIFDSFSSGAGLEDAVLSRIRVLIQYDEIDTLFRSMKRDTTGTTEGMSGMMLTLYTDSGSSHSRRQLSLAKLQKDGVPEYTVAPMLSIFGTAIPKQFFDSMSERMLGNGLFARCFIIPAEKRQDLQDVSYINMSDDFIDHLRGFAGSWFDAAKEHKWQAPKMTADGKPEEIVVPMTEDAKELFEASRQVFDEDYNRSESTAEKALLARCQEKVKKVALILAVQENYEAPEITEEHIRRAFMLVDYCTRKALFYADTYCAENEFHDLMQKVKRRLKNTPMKQSKLLRYMHISAKQLDEVLTTLGDADEVVLKDGLLTLKEGENDD